MVKGHRKSIEEPHDSLLRSSMVELKTFQAFITGLYKLACDLNSKRKTDTVSFIDFKARYKDMEKFRDRYHIAYTTYMAECMESAAKNKVEAQFNELQDLYYSIQVMYEDICSLQAASNPTISKQVCLPKISINTFSGVYTEWSNFIALFDSLIHKNSELGNVQKMHYLLSVLDKEPLSIIRHLELSDSNYPIAYNLLKDRYDNKRLIADKHLDSILSLTSLNSNNFNSAIRKFVNTLKENTQALTALGFDVQSWSFVLLHTTLRKLPSDVRSRFELSHGGSPKDIPSFDDLLSLLENQLRVMETVSGSKGSSEVNNSQNVKTKSNQKAFAVNTVTCTLCKGEHNLYHCEIFNGMTASQRREAVIKHSLCFNCLRKHSVNKCTSRSRCSVCNGRHHTKLHINKEGVVNADNSTPQQPPPEDAVSALSSTVPSEANGAPTTESTMLLGTALVRVQDVSGQFYTARALLDSGSQVSIMTENLAQQLGLPRSSSGALYGLGGSTSQRTNGRVHCTIRSLHDSNQVPLSTTAIVVKRITGPLPNIQVSSVVSSKCRDRLWPLADDKFHLPGPVDLLLGVDVYNDIFNGERESLGNGLPTAHSTIFGWVLLGPAPSVSTRHHIMLCRDVSLHCVTDLDKALTRFWEVEEPPTKVLQDPEDLLCEQHFVETHSRDSTGRFVVRLPFKPIRKPLGDTRAHALKRFFNLERRLAREPRLRGLYIEFMRDYLAAGHMRAVPSDVEQKYYIPHHGVLKESSSTTKLRAVFDASLPSSSGVSLNQTLMPGPKLQENIADIILRFRTHKVVFTCDIKQMYRQIRIHDDDCTYQTIFWRESPQMPLQQYVLTTVTYGVASSAYLAMRVVHELAVLNQSSHPEAARALQEDIFVDDIVSGAEDVESARRLQRQIVEVLSQGGLMVRKWASNNANMLQDYPDNHLETPFRFVESGDQVFKILGVEWEAGSDKFVFHIGSFKPCNTKRQVLSNIARIYDPCGYLAPVVFYAKSVMQQLWLRGDISWDDPLPADILEQWTAFSSGLDLLDIQSLPRFILTQNPVRCDIMGFSDACEKGYSAVVYLRVEDSCGAVDVHLLMAKTRVAPVRQRRTIPQLELMGAVLLADLIGHVKGVLARKININDCVAWCDSSIVLSWLRTSPHKLKVFEGNRVSQVQGMVPYVTWRHVPTELNPADCASRGLLPQDIIGHSLWWSPDWLKEEPLQWPPSIANEVVEFEPLTSSHVATDAESSKTSTENVTPDLVARFSSLSKLQRVTAWSLRFVHNARNPASKREGFLSAQELEDALRRTVKLVQGEVFGEVFQSLRNNKVLKGPVSRLHPFIDKEGLLRVGGRLKHSHLPFSVKHPMLLPKSHHLTNIIIDYYHQVHLHAGPSCLIAILHQRFWILSARRVIRHRVFLCQRCSRLKAKPLEPFMGNLPPARIRQAKPFINVGIDFAGPFNIKVSTTRNAKVRKAYLCVFICLAVKAIHLEVTSDLSTNAFMACFHRFVARRGAVANIYSDCGKNFQGAKRYLCETQKFLIEKGSEIAKDLACMNITWHMNPPYSPHMGGIWESVVKAAKTLLKRTVGERVLTFEELSTLFSRIEAVLNSRPLCPISDDPNSLEALTPGHFLTGQPLTALPELDLESTSATRLDRWQLVQQIAQHFWRRWHVEYLHNLQQRSKWNKSIPNLAVGDLVLIKDDHLPPLQWRMARVSALHPGSDGVVRVVDLKTNSGSCLRSLSRVCPLPKCDAVEQ